MKGMYIKLGIVVIITCTVAIGLTLFLTYVFRLDTPVIIAARGFLKVPAIIVDGEWIPIAEIDENTKSIKKFYENQDFASKGVRIDFETEDGQKRLRLEERKMINKLIENIAIKQLAKEWGITISDEAVQTAMDRPMEEMGTRENVVSRLDRLYGWSLDDFGEKVVRIQLLQEKVIEKFKEDNSATEEMQSLIQSAKKELDDGRVFSDVAKKYSEGATAEDGGVMGWFANSQVQDEIGQQVFSMEKGEYSDIIDTPLGLHIIFINETSESDGQKMAHISQIVIKKLTFVDFLYERVRKMNVHILVPEYTWNTDTGQVDFIDDGMKQFEEKTQEEELMELMKELEEKDRNTSE